MILDTHRRGYIGGNPPPHKPSRLLFWTLALLLATLACATRTRGVPPADGVPQTAANGLIAYLGADGNLYTMDENGADSLPITQDPQNQPHLTYQSPTWSPNGRHLAFVALEINGNDLVSRVLVFTPKTGEIVEIFSSEAESSFYLYWSPDSERVSFLTSAPGSPHLFLRLAFLNGEESRIIDTGQPYYWVWSPDGEDIFVHEGGDATTNPDARLSFLSPGDGQTQTFELAPDRFQAPSWSPDGTQLLAALAGEEGGALSLLDLNGSPTQTLAEFDATVAYSWSPDGEKIAYIATTLKSGGSSGPLNVITPGTEARQTTFVKDVLAYFWAPDSQKIAYFTPDGSGSIEAKAPTHARGRIQAQGTLRLSLHVMDVETGAARHLATFEPTADFLNVLPFFDQYHHSATIWAPNSAKLVYTARKGEAASVWVVPVAGDSAPVQLAEGTLAFWSWK